MKILKYSTVIISLLSSEAYANNLTKNEKEICKNVKTDACVKFCKLKVSDKYVDSSTEHTDLRNECQADAVKYNEAQNNK